MGNELQDLCNGLDIVTDRKIIRLQFLRHMFLTDDCRFIKQEGEDRLEVQKRQLDNAQKDLRELKVGKWRWKVADRQEQAIILKESRRQKRK